MLGLFAPEGWDNYIWRGFKVITDPFVRVVRFVTPAILTQPVVIIFGVLWLMILRLAFPRPVAISALRRAPSQGS